MSSTSHRRIVLTAAAVTLAVAALGAGAWSLRAEPVAASNRDRATAVLDHNRGTGEVPEAPPALIEQVSTAGGLRVGLRVLLAQHVALTLRTIDGAVADSADLEGNATALRANSQTLTAAIGLVYGPAGGKAFDELWSQHAQFLVAYGAALGEGDDEAAAVAVRSLGHYHQDFTSFCSLATGLPEPAVDELIGLHIDRLLAYGDAVMAGDRASAARILDQATVEVVGIADAMASAIVEQHPELFPGAVDAPETERLASLAAGVTRIGFALVEAHRGGEPVLIPTAEDVLPGEGALPTLGPGCPLRPPPSEVSLEPAARGREVAGAPSTADRGPER